MQRIMTLKQERVLRTAIDCAKFVYGVDPRVKCRERNYVWGRRAVYIELIASGLSLDTAGQKMNLRDHSTVSVAVKEHRNSIETDKPYRDIYLAFKKIFDESMANDENRTIEDVKESVLDFNYRIENELIGMGYDWNQISEFWRSVSDVKLMEKSA